MYAALCDILAIMHQEDLVSYVEKRYACADAQENIGQSQLPEQNVIADENQQ